jgi:uncharacterized protein (TIGR02145 family)
MKYIYIKFNLLLLLIIFSPIFFAQNSIQDIDGNSYLVIRIDSTEWMTSNLKTTRFSNGDSIPTTPNSKSKLSNDTNMIYRWAPAGDKKKIKGQGYLYTWATVIDNRGICPTGWKVPSDAEWKIAIDKIYNETNSLKVSETDNSNFIYKKKSNLIEIPLLKEVEFAGSRMLNGNYIFQQSFAYYWSSTLDYKGFAWMWYFSKTNVNHYNFEVNGGLSVRCMRTNSN